MSRRVLGNEHPGTLLGATNLASTYTTLGKFAEAEALLVDTLAANRRVRGAAHPETLSIVRGLGYTYDGQGRDADDDALGALCHF